MRVIGGGDGLAEPGGKIGGAAIEYGPVKFLVGSLISLSYAFLFFCYIVIHNLQIDG